MSISQQSSPPDSHSRSFLGVFRYSRRALELVWSTSRKLTVVLGVLTLLAGVLPAGMAFVGALIIDSVVAASQIYRSDGLADFTHVFSLVALEALIVAAPDLVVTSARGPAALADLPNRHPVLEAAFGPMSRIAMPHRFWICGAPVVVNAVERLKARRMRMSAE